MDIDHQDRTNNMCNLYGLDGYSRPLVCRK